MLRATSAALLLGLTACTSTRVSAVDPRYKPLPRVCIEQNAKVMVEDFVPVVEDGFRRHGIATAAYAPPLPADCRYTLTYTALRGWDFVPFLKYAELRLSDGHQTIGTVMYKHRGGFGLNKWASTESKMAPLLDELLAAYPGADARRAAR